MPDQYQNEEELKKLIRVGLDQLDNGESLSLEEALKQTRERRANKKEEAIES